MTVSRTQSRGTRRAFLKNATTAACGLIAGAAALRRFAVAAQSDRYDGLKTDEYL